MNFEQKPYYSPAEVAAIVGVNVRMVLRRIEAGDLVAAKLSSKTIRIPYASLMHWVNPARAPRATAVSSLPVLDDREEDLVEGALAKRSARKTGGDQSKNATSLGFNSL